MSELTKAELIRTIQQARDDMATWPEWMREAARMGAAIPLHALSVADEMDRLRAENWRLRSLLNMWSATFAEFFVPGTLGGDLLVATRAELAKYSRNAAEPNAKHERTPE